MAMIAGAIVICVIHNSRNKEPVAKAEETTCDRDAEFAADLEKLTDSEIEAAYYPSNYTGFRYSSLPGMSTWPYGNHQNMVDACQIPEEVLEQLSTSDLVQTVMFYPLLDDIYAFDSVDDGFEIVKDHFRGLAELCARTDRVECLYNWLRDNREWFASTPTTSGNLYVDYLKKSQRTRFFLLANRAVFFTEEINSTEAVIDAVNAILSESNGETREDNSRDYSLVEYIDFVSLVQESMQTVYTPRGGPMDAKTYSVAELWLCSDNVCRTIFFNDFSSAAKTSMKNFMYSRFGLNPDSGRGASVKYNCHSYAWYSTSSSNPNWIEIFNTTNYTSATMQSVNVGGIIVYCESYSGNIGPSTERKHSAIVTGKIYHPVQTNTVTDFTMKSKWGMYGLYTHNLANCPYYYYDSTNYVSDRLYYN